MKIIIIVSACLCGINCKYNGGNSLNKQVLQLFKEGKAIPVCPEQLGGLSTPRVPLEIIGGTGAEVLEGRSRIIATTGEDGTEAFIKGAKETLNIAKACGAKIAIMKTRSPSCGLGTIYDGTYTGNKIDGNGVTAELLIKNGIEVFTDENLFQFKIDN